MPPFGGIITASFRIANHQVVGGSFAGCCQSSAAFDVSFTFGYIWVSLTIRYSKSIGLL